LRKPAAGLKIAAASVVLATTLLTAGVSAAGQTRALKIYHLHTHEKMTIVFKRNGRYDAAGLKKLNYILRDWRRNEPTRMDPRLFDLVWEVYQKSGSHDYINIICGYRAPETNSMLRSRSRGVAEKSQHMLGKALDFYIPDVPLKKLREIGVKFQVGGVGFYPTSGSPFVHMDVGGVRAWPRLPRRELARLFPDGKTLHHPAEGGQMPGYAAALADYKRRVGSNAIEVAGGNSKNSDNARASKSLLAALFSRADENEEEITEVPAKAEQPKADRRRNKPIDEQPILTAAADENVAQEEKINAPVPVVRPAFNDDQPTIETALLGGMKKNSAEEAMQAALTPKPEEALVAQDQETKDEFANLAQYHIPVPELLAARKRPGDSDGELLTASLDPSDVATMSSVPVPGSRPEEQASQDQAASGEQVAKADDGETMPAGDLRAEEIAALAAETSDDQADVASTDEDIADSLDQADKDAQGNLAEMASLDIPKETTVTRSFTLPANVKFEDEAPVVKKVVKGARPNHDAVDAAVADNAPKLTTNMIAQWAMTKGRAEVLGKPVKAPRFVSRTMRKQPNEVYADGFSQNTAQVDPARFSGTAVNFMPVKKFTAQD
jgi:uncharacterized protein YcbK (DUF882 family)